MRGPVAWPTNPHHIKGIAVSIVVVPLDRHLGYTALRAGCSTGHLPSVDVHIEVTACIGASLLFGAERAMGSFSRSASFPLIAIMTLAAVALAGPIPGLSATGTLFHYNSLPRAIARAC